MKKLTTNRKALAAFILSAHSLAMSSLVLAQDDQEATQEEAKAKPKLRIAPPMEEVTILGRLQDAAQDLVYQRMDSEIAADYLGAEQISKVGDSNIAVALKRVPGLTLVNNQFIYVRGLGERYSSATLNGATVPSPDLTRNVIPLDIFPASIIQTVAVQKGYSPDMPASFGGGNIGIETKGVPDQFVFNMEVGLGFHSESGDYLTYQGGEDSLGGDDGTRAVSSQITTALNTYAASLDALQFDVSPQAIQATSERQGNPMSLDEARVVNAQLATQVYRNLDLSEESKSIQGQDFSIGIGNIFDVGEVELGVIASIDYDTSVKSVERTSRTLQEPDQEFSIENKSAENVSITGMLNIGARWGEDHEIASKNIFLKDTDNDATSKDFYNSTSSFGSGRGFRNYGTRFEERELEIYQLSGKHVLGGETKDTLGLGEKFNFLNDLSLNWFYSDSTATTSIPGESNVQASFSQDVDTLEISSVRVTRGQRMLDVRYTDLDDSVESSGFNLSLPIAKGGWSFELSGGGKFDTKARTYKQLDLSIGSSLNAIEEALTGSIAETFSDANLLNEDYDYTLSYLSGNSRSYLAASTTDAAYGKLSIDWEESWNVVLGARYEEYKQFSTPWQPYRLNGSQLRLDYNDDGQPKGTLAQNELYPSFALTYRRPDFITEDFNLRLDISETVVRPDLREVSDSSYADPLTDILVSGNPDVVPAELTNFGLRAEWFSYGSDSFSVSLFYKDITNPIEYFEGLGTESSITATIENAESGETKGIEVEWLKNLGFINELGELFYINGNLTLAESEINVGAQDFVGTNRIRPLTGASEYTANIVIGFDSDNEMHAATIAYNVFGERIFTAGVSGNGDSYEQPFNALDFTYSYFPSDNFTIKFKARNLLDDSIVISQEDADGNEVDIYEETVGQSYSLSVNYNF